MIIIKLWLQKDVTSSVLVVDTSEKKESLRPSVLPFPPPTLFSNINFYTRDYDDENSERGDE